MRTTETTIFALAFALLLVFPAVAGSAQTREGQTNEAVSSVRRAEAGRILLEAGVAGLQTTLAGAGAPPMTFDQETQVRSVYDAHIRALNALLAANGGNGPAIAPGIRALGDQLLLAAIKFLNPAQRAAWTGSLSASDFAELNSDLPEDEAELREYISDLRSPVSGSGGGSFGEERGVGIQGGGLVIDGFGGGRLPNRDEILEIRINENTFTAQTIEQTRGQTEIITRGGTGRYNGDFSFNFADESLDARNAFADRRPPYQQREFSGNVSGPVIRDQLTLTFSFENENSEFGDNLLAYTSNGVLNNAITRPLASQSYTARATAQLSLNHVLNTSVTWANFESENNNVGGFGLPEQGHIRARDDFNFQVKETAILSRALNNEVRFRYIRATNKNSPFLDAPYVDVTGAFRKGGSPNNQEGTRHDYEFGNLLMYTGNRWAVRAGFDGVYLRARSTDRNNFRGTFTFDTLEDYLAGIPSQYEVTFGEPLIEVSQFETGTFIQSDWRTRNDLTLSFGVRYQKQTNVDDNNNFDPRLGFAYSLGRSTVFRGGSGIFHGEFFITNVIAATRLNGEFQRTVVIKNPSYLDPLGSGELDDRPLSIRAISPDLVAPYNWISEASIEHSFSSGLVLTGSYRFARGVHQIRARNTNAPYDGTSAVRRSCQPGQDRATCVTPDPARGIVTQLESTGTGKNHTFRLGVRHRFSFLNINGNYNFNSQYDDTYGTAWALPADNYDLASEWGRSRASHSVNSSFNVRLPWNINADTLLVWQSGSPYTLRTGRDDNQDGSNNDRPAGVPRNSLTGPSFFEVGMNLSKSVQLRSDQVLIAGENGRPTTGPAAGGGYYGLRTGLRMTITAEIQNLLNKVNFSSYNGIQTSSFFGLPTSARSGRKILMSARFNF